MGEAFWVGGGGAWEVARDLRGSDGNDGRNAQATLCFDTSNGNTAGVGEESEHVIQQVFVKNAAAFLAVGNIAQGETVVIDVELADSSFVSHDTFGIEAAELLMDAFSRFTSEPDFAATDPATRYLNFNYGTDGRRREEERCP